MSPWLRSTIEFGKRMVAGFKVLPNLRSRHLPQVFESFNKSDWVKLSVFAGMFILAGGFLIHAYFFVSSGNSPDFGGEHIEGMIGQPRFINPILAAASGVDSDLSKLIYAQLLKFDTNLNLIPELAENLPEISGDQKTYTLKLKSGLKWQDDKPITADDVVFTIETIQNPDFESPLLTNWSRVKVEKIDDLTIKFTLHQVSAAFLTNFALGIIPKHIWDNMSANNFRLSDANLRPIASGPYLVREIKKTPDGSIKSMTLRANDQYLDGSPYITYFTLKFYPDEQTLLSAFTQKEIQSLGFIPFDNKIFWENSDKLNQYQMGIPQYQAVFFNLAKNQLANEKAVRQALWLTTNRDEIVHDVYLNLAQPAFGPILTGNLGYNEHEKEITHYNPAEAAEILDKAGWQIDDQTQLRYRNVKKGKDTVRQNLEFNLATNVSPLNIKTAQILEKQWSQIGVKLNLVIVSAADLQDNFIRPRNFDALLFSENTGADPDPFAFWHSSQSRDPGLNLSGFANATADKLLTEARQTTDIDLRIKNYEQFQNIVTQELPAIFLTNTQYIYLVPTKEKGVQLETIIYPSERFMDVRHWYIKTR